ncbi:wax ester/triacylglycerol synthase family O-acyltransferase [Kitasatospora sp. NPDC018619]|uniref:wax ester/triacylglycerol synthase family O-acyltransferase n=1 Tax=unclassified Kitasatospora TaxID=2633591 RepID=UPI003787CCEB
MARIRMPDRVFLALESARTPQHVALLATFGPPPGAEPGRYVQRLFERIAAAPVAAPFSFRPRHARWGAFDGSWEELAPADVDLTYHLRRSALPAPGGERELTDLVSRLHSRPLDTARPLWECHLIEGLAGDRFALYVKVHHALTDGLGIQQRLRHMLGTDPLDDQVRPLWSVVPAAEEAGHAAAAGGAEAPGRTGGAATTALGLGRAARTMLRGVRARADRARAVPFLVPRSPLNGAVGRQRQVITRSYPFARFRGVAKAAGVTVNDVLLAVCGGALREGLLAAGALPARSLTAGTPVSTRKPGDAATANSFAMTVMSLGTDVADPLERLRTVARSGELAKRELAGLPEGTTGLYGALFTWPFVAQNVLGLAGATRPPYNVVVSNIPGPAHRTYFAGCPLETVHPLGSVCHGVGLFVAARSAGGRLNLGLVGDRALLAPLAGLGDRLGEQLDALERALGLT